MAEWNRRVGQSVAEYTITLTVVTMAITGISLYVRRSIQAGIKSTADQLGDQLMGVRYESSDPLDKTRAIGRIEMRNTVSETTSNRWMQRAVAAGGAQRVDFLETSTTEPGLNPQLKRVSITRKVADAGQPGNP